MNCDAAIRLPHCILVCSNTADDAADLDLTAIYINCAADYIADLGAFFHCNGSALHPNGAGGAHGAGIAFHTIIHHGILDLTAAFHDQLSLFGHTNSGHAAEVAQHSTTTQCHGAGHSGVGGNDSVLHKNRIIIIRVAVTADSLSEYSTLVPPCIVQNDVGKSQADRTRR